MLLAVALAFVSCQDPAPARTRHESIIAALTWLAKHQEPDGSWSCTSFSKRCGKSGPCTNANATEHPWDAGVTGLALLAFLSAGYDPECNDTYGEINFGYTVRRGLAWLAGAQGKEGSFASLKADRYMYCHAIALYACARALLTGPRDADALKLAVRNGVRFIESAHKAGTVEGWRYAAGGGDSDMSVTVWCIEALAAAKAAGVETDAGRMKDAMAWIDSVTEENFYRVGYTHKGTGKVFVPGVNEQFNHHESLSAAALTCRVLNGVRTGKVVDGTLKLIEKDLPEADGNDRDFYYWHHATVALSHFKGKRWETWKDRLIKETTAIQKGGDGCDAGSWAPDDRWGIEGGRVFSTAINAFTLAYATLPAVFARAPRATDPKPPPPSDTFIFHLKSGGKLSVSSYAEKDGKFNAVLTAGGKITLKKEDVERIEKQPAK